MNLSKKVSQTDAKLSSPSKATTLNPNAAEFIPFSLRTPFSGTTSSVDATARLANAGALGRAVLDRSESSISNNSEDEVHQYWRCQLPDDITPDFKVVGEESQGLNDLSLAGLSIHDDIEGLMFHSSKGSRYIFNEQEELSQQHINGNNFLNDIFAENAIVDDTNLNPLEFLASMFSGFAAESLVIVTLVSIRTLVQTLIEVFGGKS